VYAYSISKDAATPPELPPILYINQARALGWEAVGSSAYLVPLDAALARPPGMNGSIWDVLQARADLSTTASLIRDGLPELQEQLAALPDVVGRKGYRTLFAPGAWLHCGGVDEKGCGGGGERLTMCVWLTHQPSNYRSTRRCGLGGPPA
jgi:hypothetical protein